MPETPKITQRQRYETEGESLRLVVEKRLHHWQVFVYDVENYEVLYTAERPTVDAAKVATLEFAAVHAFGPKHGLNLPAVVTMLMWEPC